MISACLNEKSWAQKYLYEKYFPLMMGICLRYSNNQEDAKDICNEAFIKIFRNLQKYKVGTSIEGWMRRIMINTSIDFYRKSIRHRSEDLETVQYKVDDSVDLISSLSATALQGLQQREQVVQGALLKQKKAHGVLLTPCLTTVLGLSVHAG